MPRPLVSDRKTLWGRNPLKLSQAVSPPRADAPHCGGRDSTVGSIASWGGGGRTWGPYSPGTRPSGRRSMASPAQSGFPARTNSRLDAFLRRHLAPKDYDAIRAYEPCIVVSDSENHTFKYVVLSDRLIYLTENPPKSIRWAVALRDVVAIELVRHADGLGCAGSTLVESPKVPTLVHLLSLISLWPPRHPGKLVLTIKRFSLLHRVYSQGYKSEKVASFQKYALKSLLCSVRTWSVWVL